jgi:hypothetical protein
MDTFGIAVLPIRAIRPFFGLLRKPAATLSQNPTVFAAFELEQV